VKAYLERMEIMKIGGISHNSNYNARGYLKNVHSKTTGENPAFALKNNVPQTNSNKDADMMELYFEGQARSLSQKQKLSVQDQTSGVVLQSGESDQDIALSDEQIQYLKNKYDLSNLMPDEQRMLMEDLYEMGFITKEEAAAPFVRTETQEELDLLNSMQIKFGAVWDYNGLALDGKESYFDSLTKRVNLELELLGHMKSLSNERKEEIRSHIQSEQKILEILKQLMS
jgi:hypothetical protein